MQQLIDRFSTATFNYVHTKNLVYNTCWEDPRCDRQLLDLQHDSKVVMITSAGCNALDYLLDKPSEIHCVDMNPRQNALLSLKLAAYDQQSSHSDLFGMFGAGRHANVIDFYKEVLRKQLPLHAQKYWDANIYFFSGKGVRQSFYHHGTSGIFAWMFGKYMKHQHKIFDKIQLMMNVNNVDKQRELYEEIEPKLFNNFTKWVMNRHLVMCMLGVPKAQQALFAQRFEQGALGFIKQCLHKVFTQLPTKDNYFWRVYLNGSYTEDCCPNYLKTEHFTDIQSFRQGIKTYNTTVSDFLKENPSEYSHYVLLDHQDWLAHHFPKALEEEWRLILKNSKIGTKILLRSASENIDFFPQFVKDSVSFEVSKTQEMHRLDRVGTYASVYLGEVR